MSRILRSAAPTVLAGVLAAGAAIAQDSVFEPPADVGYTKPMASSADYATEAYNSANANYATNAGNANHAANADNANYAARAGAAGSADFATKAGSADFATRAGSANNAAQGAIIGTGVEIYYTGWRTSSPRCESLTGTARCGDQYTVPPGQCSSGRKLITAKYETGRSGNDQHQDTVEWTAYFVCIQ